MDDVDLKLKHLEFIQAAISRMNHCSFLLKGWSVTLVSALFALSAKNAEIRFVLVAYFPVIVFWILDGYFLDQEKRYRRLYSLVVADSDEVPSLEMNTSKVESISGSWASAAFTRTLLPFHGVLAGSILLAMFGFMATRTD